jgi:hypothetical protein
MPRVQQFSNLGSVGVLKPCCTTRCVHTRAPAISRRTSSWLDCQKQRPVMQPAPQGAHACSKGRHLTLTVVRRNRAGHGIVSKAEKSNRRGPLVVLSISPWCGGINDTGAAHACQAPRPRSMREKLWTLPWTAPRLAPTLWQAASSPSPSQPERKLAQVL